MKTEKLKKLIIENPELPIKFFVKGDSVDDYQDAVVILDDVTIDKFHEDEFSCYVYSKHAELAKDLALFNDVDIVQFNNLNEEEQDKIAQKIEDEMDWTKAIIVWLEGGA